MATKKCFEQAHMTCAEFGLWVQYQKLSYTSGRLYCDGRRTAERFSGESKDHIYRLRRLLVEKGWLEVVKGSERDKKTQRVTVTEFKVLDHAAWIKKHSRKHCKSELFPDVDPLAPVQMAIENPVAPVQTPCRTNANEPVAPARHSTEEPSSDVNTELQSFAPTAGRTPLCRQNGLPIGCGQDASLAEPNAPPFAPVQMDSVPQGKDDPLVESTEPFAGIKTGQLVTRLPHDEGMKWWSKCEQGTTYEQHRTEIVAALLEYQKTQEVSA
jgi:hypothetical protein